MTPTTWRGRLRPVWPIAQQTAAAAVAWLVATHLAGHANPFFAPVAAVVGLNATLGRRGSNAVRLLTGAVIGVLVGELAIWLVGGDVWTMVVATFVAMLVAHAVDDARIVQAQAAVGAVLVTVLDQPEQGWNRLADAVIGSAVALVFSQLIFAPEPLRLLRQAEAAVLRNLAHGLQLTARTMQDGDRQHAERAVADLRGLRDGLASLATTRKASDRIVRHSVGWRRHAAPLVAERERADQLDLLAGSCLMLARTAVAVEGVSRGALAGTVLSLAGAVHDLAADPGGQASRRDAAARAAALAEWLVEQGGEVPAQSALAAACAAVRMVAVDVMVFAGVDPDEAFAGAQQPHGPGDPAD